MDSSDKRDPKYKDASFCGGSIQIDHDALLKLVCAFPVGAKVSEKALIEYAKKTFVKKEM